MASESESSVLAAAAGGEAEAKAPEGAAAAAAAPPAAASGGFDSNTKKTVQKIPLLKTRAGPRDGEAWTTRLKEEYMALITYIKNNKENDNVRRSWARRAGSGWKEPELVHRCVAVFWGGLSEGNQPCGEREKERGAAPSRSSCQALLTFAKDPWPLGSIWYLGCFDVWPHALTYP